MPGWAFRPDDAPGSWAAETLTLRARGRLVRLQVQDDQIVEGVLDDVLGETLIMFCDDKLRRLDSATVTAFSITQH
jgi:hypothetical protein